MELSSSKYNKTEFCQKLRDDIWVMKDIISGENIKEKARIDALLADEPQLNEDAYLKWFRRYKRMFRDQDAESVEKAGKIVSLLIRGIVEKSIAPQMLVLLQALKDNSFCGIEDEALVIDMVDSFVKICLEEIFEEFSKQEEEEARQTYRDRYLDEYHKIESKNKLLNMLVNMSEIAFQ